MLRRLWPLALVAASCARGLPDVESEAYAEAVTAFYTGVAAVQVGAIDVAERVLARVTRLAPDEPAGWANHGLVALQRRDLAAAEARLRRARALAPDHARIALISALIARDAGALDTAVRHLRRAVALEPANAQALYLLSQILEQQGGAGSAGEAGQLVDLLLEAQPDNRVALLERARLAAKRQDSTALRRALRALDVPANTRDFRDATVRISVLQAELESLPEYQDDKEALVVAPGGTDVLMTGFVRLPTPPARPAPADTALAFEPESLSLGGPAPVAWVRATWLVDNGPFALVASTGTGVLVSTAPGQAHTFPLAGGAAGLAALDYDYDFRNDLLLAGPGGARLLRQTDEIAFTDVTARAIPAAISRTAFAGAWAADLDMEGDMDLVLGTAAGPPVVLRNRGDGRFEARDGFPGVREARDFAWADLDADGDPDAVVLDAGGRVHVFANHRSASPQFRRVALPDTLGAVHALAIGDVNQDATLDLVLLHTDGRVSRLSLVRATWDAALLAHWPGYPAAPGGDARLFAADLDNNGALDLVASAPRGASTRVWLARDGAFWAHSAVDLRVTDLADFGLGRLNLVGVTGAGAPRSLVNNGARDYYSTTIRPRAAGATGDRRVNTFGIGGEIEARAGLLYQRQAITSPAVHFGLGERPALDVARIIWPNGTVQAEFNVAGANEAVLTFQRLKGSCPWVFTFDGSAMRFVTDFIWRTALGLRINAQGEAAVIHAEDWIKIPGSLLEPRDGSYDVRITAELWETHFFDHVALLVVDHPAGTEALLDERFTLPAPTPAVHVTEPLRAVAGAWDHQGRDVSRPLEALDGRYLDGFALGAYQGIAQEHSVEVLLGDQLALERPLWLVAQGWVYPTDASINVAATQGDHVPPHGLRVEVPRESGGWATVIADAGFPAGKSKTMLIDLTNAFRPGTAKRVRLSTNMEIYWDRIAWAVGRAGDSVVTHRILPTTAELRYRGFSAVPRLDRRKPEIPDYESRGALVPQWRDLEGYYTRFGDVRELNQAVDDRFIIMNAGDELALTFGALPPPAAGWTRDFVLIGDGWVKDGDLNTGFSATVLPLPYHGLTGYGRAPGRLQDDPAYRLHPEDWQVFHTRYVTPRTFQRALVPEPSR